MPVTVPTQVSVVVGAVTVAEHCPVTAASSGATGAVVSGTATANTVPLSSVIMGVLVLSNTTWKRPPEMVPSRSSCVFLMGAVPPLLNTAIHWLPLKNLRASPASDASAAVCG